jgi:hypothetical protein
MSFDIIVQDLPEAARSIEEIPDDFEPRPIGSRAAIIDAIQQIEPGAVFDEPAWGRIDGENYSIEINMGCDEPVLGFNFHITGGRGAIEVVARILDGLKLRALAPATGSGIFTMDELGPAFATWEKYRDRVVDSARRLGPGAESG